MRLGPLSIYLLSGFTLARAYCYESRSNYGLADGSLPANKTLQQQRLRQACKWITGCKRANPSRFWELSTEGCANTCVANVWPSYWNRFRAISASYAHDKYWEICPEIALHIANIQRRFNLSEVAGGALPQTQTDSLGVHVIAACPTPEFIDTNAEYLRQVADSYSKSLALNAEPDGKAARIRDLFKDPNLLKSYLKTHCEDIGFEPGFVNFAPVTAKLKGLGLMPDEFSSFRICLNATYVEAISGRRHHSYETLRLQQNLSQSSIAAYCQSDVVDGVVGKESCISGAFPSGTVSPPEDCLHVVLSSVLVNPEPVIQSFRALSRIQSQCKALTSEADCLNVEFPDDQNVLWDGGNETLLANSSLPLYPGYVGSVISTRLQTPVEPINAAPQFTDRPINVFRATILSEAMDYIFSIIFLLVAGLAMNAVLARLVEQMRARWFQRRAIARDGQALWNILIPQGSLLRLFRVAVSVFCCLNLSQEQTVQGELGSAPAVVVVTTLSLGLEAVWGVLAFPFKKMFLFEDGVNHVVVHNITNLSTETGDQCRAIEWSAGKTDVDQQVDIRRCWTLVEIFNENSITANSRTATSTAQFTIQAWVDGIESLVFTAPPALESFVLRVHTDIIQSDSSKTVRIVPTYSPADLHPFIVEALRGTQCPVLHQQVTKGENTHPATGASWAFVYFWTMNCTYAQAATLNPPLKVLAAQLLMNHIDLQEVGHSGGGANSSLGDALISEADVFNTTDPRIDGLRPDIIPKTRTFHAWLKARGGPLIIATAEVPHMNFYGSLILAVVAIVVYWGMAYVASKVNGSPDQSQAGEDADEQQLLLQLAEVPANNGDAGPPVVPPVV